MKKVIKVTIINTEEDIEEFIDSHRGEIYGLYRDKYYRNGGNGLLDAIGEVEHRYNTKIDTLDLPDETWNKILRGCL